MDKEDARILIQEKEKEGKICFRTIEGLMSQDIKDALNQPTEGLLYDLNRDKVTVLTWMDEPKWINDYAVAVIIEYLHDFYIKHKEEK